MSITGAIVLFAVTWFMVFFIVLPLGNVTQGDAGQIVPGTHASSPHEFDLGRKMRITTIWAVVIWAGLSAMLIWGPWGVRDLDWFGRMDPEQVN
ncbi:DUF1467 family protein [Rubellimicrobium arenae]|uniref:DUF1467 family protein n=1 Tax=Rubellimicrobium arenae TaxID=2817372 RepID=UPI001B303CC5|nr:DUF1467 family protein [Rubellimicrobium arenae]